MHFEVMVVVVVLGWVMRMKVESISKAKGIFILFTLLHRHTHKFLHIRETRAFYLHIALQVSSKSLVIFFSPTALLAYIYGLGGGDGGVWCESPFFLGKIYMHFYFSHLTLSLSPHLLSILSFAHRTFTTRYFILSLQEKKMMIAMMMTM